MANQSEIDARLWMHVRTSKGRILTVDSTLRVFTLSQGNWRLYGATQQTYYLTRNATDATGTLAAGEAAPLIAALNAPVASAASGFAWGTDGNVTSNSGSSVQAGNFLPTDATLFAEFSVAPNTFMNVYIATASSTSAPVLEGPR